MGKLVLGKLLLGKLVAGEVSIGEVVTGEVVTGEIVFGKWPNTPICTLEKLNILLIKMLRVLNMSTNIYRYI